MDLPQFRDDDGFASECPRERLGGLGGTPQRRDEERGRILAREPPTGRLRLTSPSFAQRWIVVARCQRDRCGDVEGCRGSMSNQHHLGGPARKHERALKVARHVPTDCRAVRARAGWRKRQSPAHPGRGSMVTR